MNNLKHCTDDGFTVHPAIIKALADGETPSVFVGDGAVGLKLTEVKRPCLQSKTFEGLTLVGDDRWVWLCVRVWSDDPEVEVLSHLLHGGSQTSKPLIERHYTSVRPGFVKLDDPGEHALPAKNGQGTTLKRWLFNYDTSKTTDLNSGKPMGSTDMSPADPTQTGIWPYMGVGSQLGDMDLETARAQLYAHGRRCGMFIHAIGRPLLDTDEIVNGAYLYNGETFHASGPKPWIKYTNPKAPWMDRSAKDNDYAEMVDGKLKYLGNTIHNQDGQHMTQAFALSEAAIRWPEDEGFRWLLKMMTSTYLLQIQPDRVSSQARARGRVPLSGFRMAAAFEVLGEETCHQLVLKRVVQRVKGQAWDWQKAVKKDQDPIPQFGSHENARSPNECGIWYSMMPEARAMAKRHGWPDNIVGKMMRGLEQYCFDAFREFPDLPGERGWGVPYFTGYIIENMDGHRRYATTPTTALFVCLAAVNHANKPEDAAKMAAIRGIYAGLDGRYKL